MLEFSGCAIKKVFQLVAFDMVEEEEEEKEDEEERVFGEDAADNGDECTNDEFFVEKVSLLDLYLKKQFIFKNCFSLIILS